jgi:hypothetical protein
VLHSGHKGDAWTDAVMQGIYKGLDGHDEQINFWIEHMDSERFSDHAYMENLHHLLRNKYADKRLDVVIANGNNAIDFLVHNRDQVFHSVPVVFCGA